MTANPSRVLIFLPCLTLGGAEKQGALLARYLANEGYDVEVWGFPSLASPASLKTILRTWGIVHRELSAWPMLDWGFANQPITLRNLARRYYRWPQQLRSLRTLVPPSNFDVVIPFTAWPCLVSILMRDRLGARKVLWNHRGGFNDAGLALPRFLLRTIRKSNPLFVANSAVGADFLRHTFHLSHADVHVIRNVVSPDFDSVVPQATREELPAPRLSLVHIANFFPEKDPETVIRAMETLHVRVPLCHLHFAGTFPDPSYRQALEAMVKARHLHGAVTIHGALQRHQVQTLLNEAAVGLLSSTSEGTPNSILEYMYSGLPVVATDIPGIREAVGEDNAQWLFKVGDARRLSMLLENLAQDPELRTRLGAANRKRVLENYAADSVLPSWKPLLSI